jgi:hypothetical protein
MIFLIERPSERPSKSMYLIVQFTSTSRFQKIHFVGISGGGTFGVSSIGITFSSPSFFVQKTMK